MNIDLPEIPVTGGTLSKITPEIDNPTFIVKKGNGDKAEPEISLDEESVKAPIQKGQRLGEIVFKIDGTEAARKELRASCDVPKIKLMQMYTKMLKMWVSM